MQIWSWPKDGEAVAKHFKQESTIIQKEFFISSYKTKVNGF